MADLIKEEVKGMTTLGIQLNNALYETGLAPGSELWAIRDTCYECPEYDDHCGIGCDKKGQRYLEKTKITEVRVVIRESVERHLEIIDADDSLAIRKSTECHLEIVDADNNQYTKEDLGLRIFTKREEAVEQL